MIFGFQVNMENLVMPSEIYGNRAEKQGKKIPIFPCFLV